MPIRPAKSADIPAMMAIERDAPNAAHWSRQQYEIAVGSPMRLAILIEQDSDVEGFLVARMLGGEWEIENIAIVGGLQRQGLGTRLMAEAIRLARLRNTGAIFLEVRESNLAARSFYEKSGFVQISRRRRYYPDPVEDALIYRWTSPGSC